MKFYELENPFVRTEPLRTDVESLLGFCKINKNDSTYIYDDIVNLRTKGINLQRPYVWTLKDKQDFIISAAKRGTVGTFAIVTYSQDINGVYTTFTEVIDGKHRLNALNEFMQGNFSAGGFHWSNMSQKERLHFRMIDAELYRIQSKLTDNEKIELYLAVNHIGIPQDGKHISSLKTILKQ